MEKEQKIQPAKRTVILLRAFACLLAIVLLWAFAVEPQLLTVTEIPFTDARLPEGMDGVRVAYISDIHVGPFYRERDVELMCERIRQLDPDMLLFGGDLLQHTENASRIDHARVTRAFDAVQPRLGKFAVLGNHDVRSPEAQGIAVSILADSGFTLLDNSAVQIAPGFFVAGTASWSDGGEHSPGNRADVSKVAWTAESGAFTILLSHEPAQVKNNSAYPFALQLSGHTHGGQVSLPFLGPVAMPYGAEGYKIGSYTVGNTKLYVSRGIGTSVVRARFLEPPEIVLITLHKG